jgi:hypothetical protein
VDRGKPGCKVRVPLLSQKLPQACARIDLAVSVSALMSSSLETTATEFETGKFKQRSRA